MNQEEKAYGWFEGFVPRSDSKAVFIFTMSCYAIALGMINARIIRILGFWPMVSDPVTLVERPHQLGIDNGTIVASFIGPLLESLILIAVIELLRWLKTNAVLQVVIPTVLICLLHAISRFPIWGVLVAPGFLIDAAGYVFWRRFSFWSAAQVIYLIHWCSNIVPFLTILGRSFS